MVLHHGWRSRDVEAGSISVRSAIESRNDSATIRVPSQYPATPQLAAAMFMCRRLAGLDGRPNPARELVFRDSIDLAVELLRRIDADFQPRTRTSDSAMKAPLRDGLPVRNVTDWMR
jgi:hypothetical protein